MEKAGFLCIGKIAGVHGIRGSLKVYSYVESPSVYESGSRILLEDAAGGKKYYEIVRGNPHKRTILLTLAGVDTRSAAEELIDADIYVDKSVLPGLEEGEYYWSDIIGLEVFSEETDYLGRIESIIPTGSNDVYVVKHPDSGKETLIPALGSVIQKIDLEHQTMFVNLPEGL